MTTSVATPMSTTDRLRQVIADTLQIDAQALQAAIGRLVVATSAEHPSAPADALSVHDAAAGVTVLLADRIPAGQEAQVLAAEIERHHGRGSAQLVLGDRADELLGRLVPTNLVVDGLDEAASFAGDGERAPFVVFDVDRQENIAGPFASRDLAAVHRQEILDGHAPRLDASALSQALEAAEKALAVSAEPAERSMPLRVALAYAAWCNKGGYSEKQLREYTSVPSVDADAAHDVCEAFRHRGGIVGACSEFAGSPAHQGALVALQAHTLKDFLDSNPELDASSHSAPHAVDSFESTP